MLFLLSATPVAGVQSNINKAQQIELNSKVFIDGTHHTPGSILYVSIFDPNFNLDNDVRDEIDLTQIVEGKPIVEVKILQHTKGTITLSALDGSMKDSNGNPIRKTVESGPDTSLFEFAVKLPDDMEVNSSVTVLYHDPFALTSQPETATSSSNGVTAFLDTDKEEVSLGQDLTIFLEESDANQDSRTVESISLDKILISTDKFDETPLDIVLDKTGITTDQSSLRETGSNTGIFGITLENINSKLADRNSAIRILYFDDTPSSGRSPVRVGKIVPVVPVKIGIAFSNKEYSSIEQVEIRLLAQMFNVDRNKVDIAKGNAIVSTSSGQIYYPTMVETGVDTGIFVGKIQLRSNQTENPGDLLVKSGDILRVSVGILGLQVSDLATISEPLPTVTKEVESANVTIKVEPEEISIPAQAGWVKRINITVTSSVPTTIDLKVSGLPKGIWTRFLPERIGSGGTGTTHLVLVGAKYVPHWMLPDSFKIMGEAPIAHGISVSVPIIKLPLPSPPASGMLMIGVRPEVTIQIGSIHHTKGVIQYSMLDEEAMTITHDARFFSVKNWSTEPLPDWLKVKIKSTSLKIHGERSLIASAKFLIQLTASKDAPRGDYLLLVDAHGQEKTGKTITVLRQSFILLHVK